MPKLNYAIQLAALILMIIDSFSSDAQSTFCQSYNQVSSSTSITVDCDQVLYNPVTITNDTTLPNSFPANALITDIDIEIVWRKTAGSCANPLPDDAFHSETSFELIGPNTACSSVSLITTGTYSGGLNISQVTTLFDESSTNTPSGTPSSGTFNPIGNLSSCVGGSPFGVWNLKAGDNSCRDPLCVFEYTLNICVCVPPEDPVAAVANPNADCDSTAANIILTATGGSGNVFYWFKDSCYGSPIDSGLTISVPNPGRTTSFYGAWYNGPICGYSNCVRATFVINPVIELGFEVSDVSCNGFSDGVVAVIPPVGSNQVSYLWSNGDQDSLAENLSTGVYYVTVSGAFGCSAVDSVIVEEPEQLVVSNAVNNPSLSSCDGSISLIISGGIGGYSISWNNGDSGLLIDSLCPGTYIYLVQDSNGCSVSDTITLVPECPSPNNLQSSPLSATSVKLSWDAVGSASSYEIQGKPVQSSSFITVTVPGGNTNSRNIFNLATNTTYVWRIRSLCDSVYSMFSSFDTFNIGQMVPCETPQTFSVQTTNSSALLKWSSVSNAVKYKIQGRKLGTSGLSIIFESAPDTSRFISGLTPGTPYIWQIQSWCTQNGLIASNLSPVDTFLTTSLKRLTGLTEESSTPNVSIVPNPFSESFNIQITDWDGVLVLKLFDLQGQLVYQKSGNFENSLMVQPGRIPPGLYMLNLTGKKVFSNRIILKIDGKHR